MDFAYSPRVVELREQLGDFVTTRVLPAEPRYFAEFSAATVPHHISPVMEELKSEARSRGLWNLFLPDPRFGAGLTNLEYAPLAEITGHSLIAPEAINCSAPDTGNMEVLALFGSAEQQETWLKPLLAGEIRSCVAMTEPGVASSDPTNISCRIEQDGDELVITGRKWWTSGAAHPLARVSLLMGLSDPEADPHRRHSFVLVPMDAPGVTVVRQLQVFGYDDPGSHCEVMFDEVRVPAANLIGERGSAFAIAQARLGAGRIHHCMRVIGTAERALALMCERARTRTAFGKLLAEQGVVQEAIARSRVELEQVRLLCHKAAWMMDTQGTKAARTEIAAIKVAAPQVACAVVDRAIQVHGGAGMSNDLPLARMYAWTRALRILDGPDEVHLQSIARRELRGA
ncbi:MAG TPA: acyl-CoA dehydrogenase family protein [Candidatus Dormibacteraeota bacterium]|jgi:acyl-CoA dehydrogenase|nr:acyl-CoA dehydrogenase family protein [Candidatus Dormibacteraeota bacterium]